MFRHSLLLLGLVLALSSCSKKEDPYAMPQPQPAASPEKVAWMAEPGAITVILDAEDDCNLIDGEGHATSLCIMQLPKEDGVRPLASTPDGLLELLQCKPRPPDILSATQLYVQPSTYRVFPMDRVEGARYVAVVAGFNDLVPETSFASVAIPIHEDTERSFLLFSHPIYSAAHMKLSINVGQATLSVHGVEREE